MAISWRSRWVVLLAAGVALLAAYAAARPRPRLEADVASRDSRSGYTYFTRSYRGVPYAVVSIDPARVRIQAYWHDPADARRRPFRSLDALAGWLRSRGDTMLVGMNGGIFGRDGAPKGLLVSDRRPLREIDTLSRAPNRREDGNFYRPQPNGVFFVLRSGEARVTTTGAARPLVPRMVAATQSGPMLVIGGALAPAFRSADTLSPWRGTPAQVANEVRAAPYTRNAVCIGTDGRVYWVKTDAEVWGDPFARFLRDEIRCRDALFLDGTFSSLHIPGTRDEPGDGLVTTLAVLPRRP